MKATSKYDVAVVIPAYNSMETIDEQLQALNRQTFYDKVEIVVVDNNSSDNTAELVKSFASDKESISVVEANEKQGAGYSRNCGVAATSAPLILFCDSDDVVAEDWIERTAAALALFDMVGGFIEEVSLNDPVVLGWKDPRDTEKLVVAHSFLPHVIGANCGIRRSVLEAVGGWAECFPGGASEDVELSWRVQLSGYTLGPAAGSVVHYRYKNSLVSLAKQYHRRGRNGAAVCKAYASRRSASTSTTTPVSADQPRRESRARSTIASIVTSLPAAVGNRENQGQLIRQLATGTGWFREQSRYRLRGPKDIHSEVETLLAQAIESRTEAS